jgi:tetratricopeptide (TPR) repeat protein
MHPLKVHSTQPERMIIFAVVSTLLFLLSTVKLNAQFKEESAQAAYELRMKGEILYAAAMLEKLTFQGKSEEGLVFYEMARTREHQSKGGANWVTPDMIIGQSQWAVSVNPDNLLLNFYDAQCRFQKAYLSMMMDSETAAEDVADAISKLEKVLVMDPGFHEVRVQLVEFYSQLPEELSGDPGKAEAHASHLESADPFFGKLARDVMLTSEQSRVDFWKKALEEHPEDSRVAVKLGKAYLMEDNPDDAISLFESAMSEDPRYNILLLHMARYHMYQAMGDRSRAQEALPLAEAAINRYLDSEPGPAVPFKAWAIGKLSLFKRFQGQEEEANRLMQEANALDPSFSKATALPDPFLYAPPGELYRSGDYNSFTRPF